MTPFPDLILRLPRNGELMILPSLGCCDCIQLENWSDGRLSGFVHPHPRALMFGPGNTHFRLSECEIVREPVASDLKFDLEFAWEASGECYADALGRGLFKDEADEAYFLEQVWIRSNDSTREWDDELPTYSQTVLFYLRRLLGVFEGKGSAYGRLMCAELHRELGEFERSEELLFGFDFGPEYNVVADRLHFEAVRGSRHVVPYSSINPQAPEMIEAHRLRAGDANSRR